MIWSFTIISILPLLIFAPKEKEMATEISLLVSTAIFSFSLTLTIMMIYADKDTFPVTGYLVIGGCFFFSFVMVGILAIDLSFTLHN